MASVATTHAPGACLSEALADAGGFRATLRTAGTINSEGSTSRDINIVEASLRIRSPASGDRYSEV